MSDAMRRINDAIGTPLVHRVGRGIVATPAGGGLIPGGAVRSTRSCRAQCGACLAAG
ncbi:LysR family transcriptional regulator [Streptomyces mirabilis]|uniref:LysR family transcriptional regulator n=1 Tax=Streptomyces mirabilis TaxID=68239 RepID=UPI00332DDA4D